MMYRFKTFLTDFCKKKRGYQFDCIFLCLLPQNVWLGEPWTNFDVFIWKLALILIHIWQWYLWENHISFIFALGMCATNGTNSISRLPIPMIFFFLFERIHIMDSLVKVWLGSDYRIRLKFSKLIYLVKKYNYAVIVARKSSV